MASQPVNVTDVDKQVQVHVVLDAPKLGNGVPVALVRSNVEFAGLIMPQADQAELDKFVKALNEQGKVGFRLAGFSGSIVPGFVAILQRESV